MTPQGETALITALNQIAQQLQRINMTLSNIQASQTAIAQKTGKF